MRKRFALALAAAAVLGAVVGAAAVVVAQLPHRSGAAPAVAPAAALRPVWREVTWPFPIDQWGIGKAFRCAAADCGTEVEVYLRAKIGFCNCTTGVADDEELDRVGDVELIGREFAPLGPGRAVTVGHMQGRSRAYAVSAPLGSRRTAIAVAFNDRCDVVVATVAAGPDRTAAVEPAALEFLNGDLVLRWATVTLGL